MHGTQDCVTVASTHPPSSRDENDKDHQCQQGYRAIVRSAARPSVFLISIAYNPPPQSANIRGRGGREGRAADSQEQKANLESTAQAMTGDRRERGWEEESSASPGIRRAPPPLVPGAYRRCTISSATTPSAVFSSPLLPPPPGP